MPSRGITGYDNSLRKRNCLKLLKLTRQKKLRVISESLGVRRSDG
jgi:hypothetical protein